MAAWGKWLMAQHRTAEQGQTAEDPRREPVDEDVTERSNAATEERLKSGHAVGGESIV
jgi:hypothetical protein